MTYSSGTVLVTSLYYLLLIRILYYMVHFLHIHKIENFSIICYIYCFLLTFTIFSTVSTSLISSTVLFTVYLNVNAIFLKQNFPCQHVCIHSDFYCSIFHLLTYFYLNFTEACWEQLMGASGWHTHMFMIGQHCDRTRQ